MLRWIRRGTRIFAGIVFFTVLISNCIYSGSWEFRFIIQSVVLAFFSAIICWFAGYVICDIIIKGMVTHIEDSGIDTLIDGGWLQRIKMKQDECVPGGEEMPLTEIKKSDKEK